MRRNNISRASAASSRSEIDITLGQSLIAILGPRGVAVDPGDYLFDRHTGVRGAAIAVTLPETVDQVSAICALCHSAGAAVVPQGGRTGLVAGAIPGNLGNAVVISLERLNRVRQIDPGDWTLVTDAGAVLGELQVQTRNHGLRFPLSIGSARSCQIGGLVATNAGGVHAMRFGSMRDLVLGLEVVLPDGSIWNGLRTVRKDNTGYDLKQLFIGSEGSLGVITGVALKLAPTPRRTVTAILAIGALHSLLTLFGSARRDLDDYLSAFELVSAIGLEYALQQEPALQRPLSGSWPAYVLIELEAVSEHLDIADMLGRWLQAQLDAATVADAAVALNSRQARELWRIRELTPYGGEPSIQFDVSVPIARILEFLNAAEAAVLQLAPNARINAFGHVGDGNIHYHICPPASASPEGFALGRPRLSTAVHDLVTSMGGSFSAEHGIGALRKPEMRRYKPSLDLQLMRALKHAVDPRGIMNPGKIFDEDDGSQN